MDPAVGFATIWKHSLLPGEHALVVRPVHLKDATTGATIPLLAVGAGLLAGEDYPCSGRVLLFEITKKEGLEGGWAARQIYQREFKGPVTAVSTTQGGLLLSTGNRIEVCMLTSTTVAAAETGRRTRRRSTHTSYKLIRTAFYDGPMLVTDLCVQPGKTSSFILLADCHHSIQFLRYVEQVR